MPVLFDALARSAPGFDGACADHVRLRSPFADYSGRADVVHLVGLIGRVVEDVRAVCQLSEGATTMSLFEARVEGQDVQGVLYELCDDSGLLVDAMLTVRPYIGLRAAMRGMQALLEESPLPSRRDW